MARTKQKKKSKQEAALKDKSNCGGSNTTSVPEPSTVPHPPPNPPPIDVESQLRTAIDQAWIGIDLELPPDGKHLNLARMRALFQASIRADVAIEWHRRAADTASELLNPSRKVESHLHKFSGASGAVPTFTGTVPLDEIEVGEIISDDENVEWEFRMPGDSAVPGFDDLRRDGCFIRARCKIVTKVGKVYSVVFASPDINASLRSVYDHHLTLRVDPALGMLCYDMIEHTPMRRWEVQTGGDDIQIMGIGNTPAASWWNPLHTGASSHQLQPHGIDLCQQHLAAEWSAYKLATVFRCRLELTSVTGIALLAQHGKRTLSNGTILERKGEASVLLFELREPVHCFAEQAAVTKVTQGEAETGWKLCPDWTPHSAASVATQHLIHGETEELTELVNYLMSQSKHITTLVEQPEMNTLTQSHFISTSAAAWELVPNNRASTETAPKRAKLSKPCFSQMSIPESQLCAFDIFTRKVRSGDRAFVEKVKENFIKTLEQDDAQGNKCRSMLLQAMISSKDSVACAVQ